MTRMGVVPIIPADRQRKIDEVAGRLGDPETRHAANDSALQPTFDHDVRSVIDLLPASTGINRDRGNQEGSRLRGVRHETDPAPTHRGGVTRVCTTKRDTEQYLEYSVVSRLSSRAGCDKQGTPSEELPAEAEEEAETAKDEPTGWVVEEPRRQPWYLLLRPDLGW